jgi:small nuclear ribonucleoprotein (snRNP)-like protein
MLEQYLGQKVVIDLKSSYVCLGTLERVDDHWLELRNADLHDFRDTETTREVYVAESRVTGIKRNRRRLLLVRADVVAVARLEDVALE